MKKQYQKPVMFAEQFAVVEHVAGGCGYSIRQEINYFDFVQTCVWDLDGLPVFTSANNSCVEQYDGTENIPYTCYDLNITATDTEPVATVYS